MLVKNNIIIIILMMISGFVATDIYLPSLPAIVTVMHTNTALAQATLSIYLFGFGLSQFIYGILSDKYGRKPIAIMGLLIFTVGSLLTILATSIELLLAARLIQGLGIGATASMGRVAIRDLYQGKNLVKKISYIAAIVVLTPAIAPVFGGFLQEYFGYRSNFIFIFGYALLLLSILIPFFPETIKYKNKNAIHFKTLAHNFRSVFTSRTFIFNLLCGSISFSVIIIFSAINPFLFQNLLHVSAKYYGLLTLIMASGMACGMILNGKLIEFINTELMIIFGFCLILISGIFMLTFFAIGILTIPLMMLPTFIAFFGVAFIGPNAAANAFMPFPKIGGFVSSVYGTTQTIIGSLLSSIASLFHSHVQLTLAILIIAISFIGLFLSSLLIRANQTTILSPKLT